VFSSRAAAFGDVNNDGAIDILIVNRDAPASLLINAVPDRGHWIICRVVDEHGRDALNATVTMTVGDTRIMRDVMVAYSYCAANDPRVHIGLGRNEVATGVEVQWIDGTVEKFGDLSCDQIHVLRRGESHGRRSSPKSASGEIRANRRDRADEEQQPDHGDDGLRSAEFSTDE
jgi:hypothetical protein